MASWLEKITCSLLWFIVIGKNPWSCQFDLILQKNHHLYIYMFAIQHLNKPGSEESLRTVMYTCINLDCWCVPLDYFYLIKLNFDIFLFPRLKMLNTLHWCTYFRKQQLIHTIKHLWQHIRYFQQISFCHGYWYSRTIQ